MWRTYLCHLGGDRDRPATEEFYGWSEVAAEYGNYLVREAARFVQREASLEECIGGRKKRRRERRLAREYERSSKRNPRRALTVRSANGRLDCFRFASLCCCRPSVTTEPQHAGMTWVASRNRLPYTTIHEGPCLCNQRLTGKGPTRRTTPSGVVSDDQIVLMRSWSSELTRNRLPEGMYSSRPIVLPRHKTRHRRFCRNQFLPSQ